MSHHLIVTDKISYQYPDGHLAIKDLSFVLRHGESVGVIGANGAGKSTLLSLFLGILFPSSGSVSVGNIPVTKKTLPFVREKIGLTFQNPDDQLFMTTVYDDVAFGPRNYRLPEEEVHKRVLNALETVGIMHLKDRPPYKLSGGEKRAVSIAAVLSMHPDILLLDEPTNALDLRSRKNLIELLKRFDHSKIIVTHDLDMLYDLCERIIILKEGEIIADGKTDEILSNESLLNSGHLELPLSLQACSKCTYRKG